MPDTPKPPRRTQAERRAETRTKLLDAARALAEEASFAECSTPDLVRRAGVTRGALYHHFQDKADLFRAMAAREAEAIAAQIDTATKGLSNPQDAMRTGTHAYFDAMSAPGRARILLIDAPVILGPEAALALTRANGSAELRDGLARARPDLDRGELDALTDVLGAAFDRAAQEIAAGKPRAPYVTALFLLVETLLDPGERRAAKR